MSINVNDVLEGIKSDVMGWINDGIASANINGITVTTNSVITATLPPYVAYTNVAQAFTEQQSISATTTDATGLSIPALNVIGWADPSADDASGIKIGAYISALINTGAVNDTGTLWGNYGLAGHNGDSAVSFSSGIVGHSETRVGGSGSIGFAIGVNGGVRSYGAGTITAGAALYASAAVVSAGAITTAYGLYIENQTGAGTNYAIYSAGGKSYHAGTLNVGGAESASRQFYVYQATTNSAGITSSESELAINSTANTSNDYYSLKGTAYIQAASSEDYTGQIVGVYGLVGHNGTGTASTVTAILASPDHNSAGVVSQMNGLRAKLNNTSGTTTAGAGVYVANPTVAAGAITTNYGVYIEVQSTGGTNYQIYSAGSAPSYFAGRLVMAEISTPSNPAANQLAVYAKDDGGGTTKLYTLDSAGTETALGSGGSGAPTDATYVTLSTNGTLTNERVLTAGANITLTDAGAGSTITVAANTKYIAFLSPLSNEPPSASYATLDTRNGHPCLDFSGTADEEAVFSLVLPAWYAGGGLTVDTYWAFTSATSGNLRVQAGIERIDESSLDIDADSFSAFQSAGGTAPGTSGQVIKVSVAFTAGGQMDSWAASEMGRLKIRRDADGTSGTDDITTDAELLGVVIRET